MQIPEFVQWLQVPLICAVAVFVVDLVGNMISFGSRFVNALVTTLLFAILATVALLGLDSAPWSTERLMQLAQPVAVGSAIVFLVSLIGNALSFQNRVMNAFVTGIVFLVAFAPLYYFFLVAVSE